MAASGLCVLVGYLYRDWFEKTAIDQRPFLFFDRLYNDEGVIPVKPRLNCHDGPDCASDQSSQDRNLRAGGFGCRVFETWTTS